MLESPLFLRINLTKCKHKIIQLPLSFSLNIYEHLALRMLSSWSNTFTSHWMIQKQPNLLRKTIRNSFSSFPQNGKYHLAVSRSEWCFRVSHQLCGLLRWFKVGVKHSGRLRMPPCASGTKLSCSILGIGSETVASHLYYPFWNVFRIAVFYLNFRP